MFATEICSGALGSPLGAGTRWMIVSKSGPKLLHSSSSLSFDCPERPMA
jgi:hypothetical protein